MAAADEIDRVTLRLVRIDRSQRRRRSLLVLLFLMGLLTAILVVAALIWIWTG